MKYNLKTSILFFFILISCKFIAQNNLYIKSDFGLQTNQSNIIDFQGNVNTILYSAPDLNIGFNIGYIKNKLSLEIGAYVVKSKLQHKLKNEVSFFFSKRLSLKLNELKFPIKFGYDIYNSKKIKHQINAGINLIILTNQFKSWDTIVIKGIENYSDENFKQMVPYSIQNIIQIKSFNKITYSLSIGYSIFYNINKNLSMQFNPYFNFGFKPSLGTLDAIVFRTEDIVNHITNDLYGQQNSIYKGDLLGINIGLIYNFKGF